MTFEIVQIPHDDESVRTHVERYKTFRLYALKTAPNCFGSTYAREIAFTDDVWYNRLANPIATTFIAVRSDCIISTLTAMGPLPCAPEESPVSGDPWALSTDPVASTQLHFRVNGMFTIPEARGQGAAKALLDCFFEFGTEEAGKAGKKFVTSIVVDADNLPAMKLYEKCGYVAVREEPHGLSRIAVLMKYPSSPSEATPSV
ncbi:hypothetical protein BDZ45DRAFT_7149 [Acephala macrosclerotiorum]|nr:hypothetical protein BDZ45DRAFT_7149 [Acephala macrosclerotiorum]